MKIAIAATSPKVEQYGAQAPYYQFIDTDSGLFEALPNPIDREWGPAGSQAALKSEFLQRY